VNSLFPNPKETLSHALLEMKTRIDAGCVSAFILPLLLSPALNNALRDEVVKAIVDSDFEKVIFEYLKKVEMSSDDDGIPYLDVFFEHLVLSIAERVLKEILLSSKTAEDRSGIFVSASNGSINEHV